jgi:hypothetical protein
MRREGLTYYDTPEEAGGPLGEVDRLHQWCEDHGYVEHGIHDVPFTPEHLAEQAKRGAENEKRVQADLKKHNAAMHKHMQVVSEIARRRRKEDREFRRWQKARIRETLLADGARASS